MHNDKSSTEETKFFPGFWFRPVISDKLYHVSHTTTMKIILQRFGRIRNVPAQRHFVDMNSQSFSLYVPGNYTKFKLKIVRHYHGILTIPSCSHQLIQHCPNLIVGGHFHRFLSNLTNNITVHVLQSQELSNPNGPTYACVNEQTAQDVSEL
jgi:hypothetical protein